MPGERILIVEDDPAILIGLREKLAIEGYDTVSAKDGEAAQRALDEAAPDLVILDLMLPKIDGLTLLRWLRQRDRELPVLILSAKGAEADKVAGLRTGADDYLAKPFGLDELIARVEALLRRTWHGAESIEFGDVRVDCERRLVFRAGAEVNLSRRELEVLLYLLRHRRGVVSREQILEGVWGYEPSSAARSVDFHILNLRRKLEKDPKNPVHLVTRHGMGFQLVV